MGASWFGYYTFYEEINEDEFKLNRIRYDDATIKIIRDSSEPRIEVIQQKWFTNWGVWDSHKNVIYVPNGSIRNNYNLDAQ